MGRRLTSFASGIVLGLALLAAMPANAQECTSGCGAQLKACVRSARANAFACKLDCLVNPPADGRRACVQGCSDAARAERSSCLGQQDGCANTCAPPAITPGAQPCLAGCGSALGDCARTVIGDVKACLSTCRDATDRLGCLRDCVGGVQTTATSCTTDLSVCAAGCGVTLPPPPPPPTGTGCTATCGSGLTQCLADLGSTAFTCAGGCAGSADLFQCLLDCKAPTQQGAAACRATFDGCTGACTP